MNRYPCALLRSYTFGLASMLLLHEVASADNEIDSSVSRSPELLQNDGTHLVIPQGFASQTVDSSQQIVDDSLHSVPPELEKGVHVDVTQDSRYILHGDLFRTNETFALIELPTDTFGDWIALAQLEGGRWRVRQIWKIGVCWSAPMLNHVEEHLPVKPAVVPFQLHDLDGDGIPEVIIASEVSRYYQAYYIFQV